jgi:hypothetical protein
LAIQDDYQRIKNWKKELVDKWRRYDKFRAGDQWPTPTARTKVFPRPVFNIIEYIENHKTSQIMTDSIKMIFSPEEAQPKDGESEDISNAEQAADLFSKYSETVWENIKQDELNDDALEDASNLGTAIWHYYWDNNIMGGTQLEWVGDMRGEIIDPANYFPGNPQEAKVQKQPWIILSYRELVDNIKEEAKSNGVKQEFINNITADKDTEDNYEQSRETDSDKALVLLKYWKEDGHIYFTKVCGNIEIKPKTDTGFTLYPIAVMYWRKRKKCAFGIGDTEELIPNQKGINRLMAMQLLNTELIGFPKVVKNSTFIPQTITNQIGEVIENNDPNGIDHIKYLNPPVMSNFVQTLVDNFMQYTKTLTGASETSTGDLNKAGQFNAQAIMLLQQAAAAPISKIKKRYYQAQEDIGRIWEQFWKVKYNTTRMITVKDENGHDYSQQFKGTDYADINMQLKIDISSTAGYSETLAQGTLDKLYDKNAIDVQMYLKYVPKATAPFKDSMLKDIQEQQAKQTLTPPMDIDQIISQLSPDEQAVLKQHPELIDQVVKGN